MLRDGVADWCGGVAEWLRRSVANLVNLLSLVRAPPSEPFPHKPTVNSAVHPSEVGKWALRSNSEDEHWTHIDSS